MSDSKFRSTMSRLAGNRYGVLVLFFAVFIVISTVTRTILLFDAYPNVDFSFGTLSAIYGTGLFFDLVTFLYFCLPFIAYLMIVPDIIYRSRWHTVVTYLVFTATIFFVVFESAAEYFFFDEFGVRFNFIAVDYLIYTREVVRNIIESYPMVPLMLFIGLITLSIVIFSRSWVRAATRSHSNWKTRLGVGAVLIALSFLSYRFVTVDMTHVSSNNYVNELAGNGIYDFVAAFRNNNLEYKQFYPVLDADIVNQTMKREIRMVQDTQTSETEIPQQLSGKESSPPNLVFIVEESLSASFMQRFGNEENLTPYLDRLSRKGLFFTRMYATGTRTARGLEAITLSLPPTPGRSIVKRPQEDGHLPSMGSVLQKDGYDLMFLYGGYGYFDNMNAFYAHYGFRTIDRADIADTDITFENAWGVCDEDLFKRCSMEFDRVNRSGKPFCAVIMTTSNHRPYTYPEGRIDIPSHTGRKGAVKYADYALGRFLQNAEAHSWFDHTVFVVVADHCASAMGKRALPVDRYHIPCLIYGPGIVQPQDVDTIASQVDILPTVLALAHLPGDPHFFGNNLLNEGPATGRAFLATYARLGYYKDPHLAILDVKQKYTQYRINPDSWSATPEPSDPGFRTEAISYYQQAADYIHEYGY